MSSNSNQVQYIVLNQHVSSTPMRRALWVRHKRPTILTQKTAGKLDHYSILEIVACPIDNINRVQYIVPNRLVLSAPTRWALRARKKRLTVATQNKAGILNHYSILEVFVCLIDNSNRVQYIVPNRLVFSTPTR
jgi:hypothetical protein